MHCNRLDIRNWKIGRLRRFYARTKESRFIGSEYGLRLGGVPSPLKLCGFGGTDFCWRWFDWRRRLGSSVPNVSIPEVRTRVGHGARLFGCWRRWRRSLAPWLQVVPAIVRLVVVPSILFVLLDGGDWWRWRRTWRDRRAGGASWRSISFGGPRDAFGLAIAFAWGLV